MLSAGLCACHILNVQHCQRRCSSTAESRKISVARTVSLLLYQDRSGMQAPKWIVTVHVWHKKESFVPLALCAAQLAPYQALSSTLLLKHQQGFTLADILTISLYSLLFCAGVAQGRRLCAAGSVCCTAGAEPGVDPHLLQEAPDWLCPC